MAPDQLKLKSFNDNPYFNNMDFEYNDSAEGWVGKIIEYRKGMAGYKKLSDIIG